METDCIPFKETNYFSSLITDYLDGAEFLNDFIHYQPQLDSFQEAISNKKFSDSKREVLVKQLNEQYLSAKIKLSKSPLVEANIKALKESSTYTVTTGHQLCLMTGPLYFIYKIVSTIKLSKSLKEKYPKNDFIPIFWMASEDHDFDEINHFHFKENTLSWDIPSKTAVGKLDTSSLKDLRKQLESLLPELSIHASKLLDIFDQAYQKGHELANATRVLAHELFSAYGLVIIDGDDKELKKLFIPHLKRELLEELSSAKVEEQSELLGTKYKLQVNPREINLFYLTEDNRARIVKENGAYFIYEQSSSFSKKEILEELDNNTERFSPNVLMRPLYQETILPNLAYIGGGGELAYWFQLRSSFEAFGEKLPVLLLRNSVLFLDKESIDIANKLAWEAKDFFLPLENWMRDWVIRNAQADWTLENEKEKTVSLFKSLESKASLIDASLEEHVKALKQKQINILDKLSEKMIRSDRKKQEVAQERIDALKAYSFPNGKLQERYSNFFEFYLAYGDDFIKKMMENLSLPSNQFYIIKE
jgi:bacillithiol biosynthesis cysteine-adding enzyme BshC